VDSSRGVDENAAAREKTPNQKIRLVGLARPQGEHIGAHRREHLDETHIAARKGRTRRDERLSAGRRDGGKRLRFNWHLFVSAGLELIFAKISYRV